MFSIIACKPGDQEVIADSLVSTVQFVSSDGILLEGTLELPTLTGTHPLVIFVHGSGRATRSDYQEIVNELLPKGYAVFRYDKRGVGASQGTYSGVSAKNSIDLILLLASDAAATISHLKKNSLCLIHHTQRNVHSCNVDHRRETSRVRLERWQLNSSILQRTTT